MRKHKAINFPL